jgi:hypothetical protein
MTYCDFIVGVPVYMFILAAIMANIAISVYTMILVIKIEWRIGGWRE